MFGDVSGKGVAAAILMSHLHATFRTLVTTRGLAAGEVVTTCLEDLAAHLAGAPKRDDLTVMTIRRTA